MGLDYIRDKTHPSPRNFVDYALRTTDFPWLRSQRPWLTWKNLRWSTVKRMDSIWVKRLILETCACFFFTAWWFRLVKKHLKLKFPLICSAGGSNLDGVGLCWALCCLQNCFRATLPAAEAFKGLEDVALEGTGRRGLPGPKIFHGNLTYLLNMTHL